MICECGNYTEGTTDKCATCNRADRKAKANAAKIAKVYKFKPKKLPPAKTFKPIKQVSKKRAKELAVYKPIRDAFLAANAVCQCCNAAPATEVHHKAGRIGKLLYNIKYFLAVCHWCHMEIEANPVWAKANGYSVDRTTLK